MNKCRICQNEQYNRIHIAREMLFGYRDTFNYIECGKCGCLQIGEIPSNLNKYYPKFYWSNVNIDDVFLGKKSLIKSKFKAIRTDCYLTFNPLLEKLVRLLPKPPLIPISGDWDWVNSFRKTNTNRSSAILDVGCGMGSLLSYLSREGFLNLVGVDPYIDREYKDASVKIFKKHVIDMEQEKFHLIMFHHSFEHMDEPFRILNELHNLLNNDGFVLIRIPIASYAWEKYGVNWVQLDPPRHFFLHTINSFRILVDKCNFEIDSIEFDSNEFQFWGSEQYIHDIALQDDKSLLKNPEGIEIFSKQKILKFREEAKKLNQLSEGDQACIYLRKRR